MANSDKLQQVNIDLRKEISGEKFPEIKKDQSYLILDSETLPDIKKWQIGHQYKVELLVQEISVEQDETKGPLEYAREQYMAKFQVIKVMEAEEE
jgi:hypothetical protein